MKTVLKKCIEGGTLSKTEAEDVMNAMMEGKVPESQMASLISILRFRGETVDEIIGFLDAMKAHMKSVEGLEGVVDTCGTGGDEASTFNISTASGIVASSLGVKVAKHGNRSVSSKSGSADVLEYLNIPIESSPKEAIEAIRHTNMSFLFAPLYHTSMKHVAKTRKEIGFRTIFNLLGPLVNPAKAKRQVIGVYSFAYAKKLAEVLMQKDIEHVLFVTGADGLDEITITRETNVIELYKGKLKTYQITPEQFGLKRGTLADIQVGSVKESANMINRIFQNDEKSSARDIVVLNAASALYVAGIAKSLYEGVHLAKEAIENGTAFRQLQTLQRRKEERYA